VGIGFRDVPRRGEVLTREGFPLARDRLAEELVEHPIQPSLQAPYLAKRVHAALAAPNIGQQILDGHLKSPFPVGGCTGGLQDRFPARPPAGRRRTGTPIAIPESAMKLERGDALIVGDVQNDFLSGGTLAVPRGDEVIDPLNQAIRAFDESGLPVFAGRDWHPPDHCSFQERGGPWPPHCVAGTRGAEFSARLQLNEEAQVVSKATERDKEAYSLFQDTGLARTLESKGVRRIFIGGLTTEYCVLNTVLDARSSRFEVFVLTDATRAINARPNDGRDALDTMKAVGARFIRSGELVPARGKGAA
jgi:nicotinamidase/pyrazinamidase